MFLLCSHIRTMINMHTYYFTLTLSDKETTFAGYRFKNKLSKEEAELQLAMLPAGTIMVQSECELNIIESPKEEESIQLIPDAE